MTRTSRWLALVLAAAVQALAPQSSAQSRISAIWANDGGDKVLREERRASGGVSIVPNGGLTNSVWDGKRVSLLGARNEMIGFVVVIESEQGAADIGVTFDRLGGPGGAVIGSRAARGDEMFDYRGRNIELFHVRYLPIKGLSLLSYEMNDERWVPSKMRRPFQETAHGTFWRATPIRGREGFDHRPGANKHFPEIAVPLETQPTFAVPAGGNQSVWVDVYVPRDAVPGQYTGSLIVREPGNPDRAIPVELTVRGFTLPDTPTALSVASLGHYDIAERWLGIEQRFTDPGSAQWGRLLPVLERYVQMLRRHGVITMLDEGHGVAPPRPEAIARIRGTLYSEAKGYEGPGRNTGDPVYFIGPYGHWGWRKGEQADYNRHTDAWMGWFAANAPRTQRMLYLIDEPNMNDVAQVREINGWIDKVWANPGIGSRLPLFSTIPVAKARQAVPRIGVLANWLSLADTKPFEAALDAHLKAAPGNQYWQYNGKRPGSGSFATEDDGTALRMVPWVQYKKGIHGWFYWNTSYYYDYQNGAGRTDVWRQAKTFGAPPKRDPVIGETSGTYSNGDGVLQYPGTDVLFPDAQAPRLNGPVASVRLKLWRRGIQDHAYLTMAMAKDPAATRALVDRMVPKVLWEVGVANPRDPSYQFGGKGEGISWPVDPDAWESARRQLADIIEGR
jgi:hypothetical protein